MNFIRSLLFNILMVVLTIFYAILGMFTYPFSFKCRYRVITLFSRNVVWLAKFLCGIKYKVEGLEHLPKESAIILSNHQSTWETLVFQVIFPLQTWVVKKELLKIPFFGWALALLDPISIDRTRRASSMEQLLKQGKKCLDEGRWIVIFPEGTRVDHDKERKFSRGGSVLAENTGAPVVPIAHNAGKFWPRKSFVKYPGTVTVKIGPVINSRENSAADIHEQAKRWINLARGEL